MSKQLQIRNSTAEFLIFQAEDKAQGVLRSYRVIQDRLFESDLTSSLCRHCLLTERKINDYLSVK